MKPSVDDILSGISDPEAEKHIDDKFGVQYGALQGSIDTTRRSLGVRPYALAERIILAHEMLTGRVRHANRERRDGSNYFDAHLMGAATALVRDQHITGLPTVLATLMHDDAEDLKIPLDRLLRTGIYEERVKNLRHGEPDELRRLQSAVAILVRGVTKVRGASRKETKAATLEMLLDTMGRYNVRVGNVKIADRSDNMKTLKGHGEGRKDRQDEIADETQRVYIPLAHLLRVFGAEKTLVGSTVDALNPGFRDGYDQTVSEHLQRFLEPFRNLIQAQFRRKGEYYPSYIRDISFVPLHLSRALHRANVSKPLQETEIADLKIDELDPLFDIVIAVDKDVHVAPLIGRIIERFSAGRTSGNVEVVQLNNSRGVMVKFFNRDFGGRLFFRVNDGLSEAKSKRGLLANTQDKAPPGLKERIDAAIGKSHATGRNIYDVVKEELLLRNIVCYTDNNDPIELTRGATPLDFAAKIHSDLLIGAQRVSVSEDIWGKGKRNFGLFDPLSQGSVVQIDSCLKKVNGGRRNGAEVKADPGWFYFCQSSAKDILTKHFKKHPGRHQDQGRTFCEKVCRMLSITEEEVIQLLDEESERKKFLPPEVHLAVARGEIDLLKTVAGLHRERTKWKIRVTLPDIPQALTEFTSLLGKGVNIGNPRTYDEDGATSLFEADARIHTGEESVYDFFKTVLKVSGYGFDIRIEPARDSAPESMRETQKDQKAKNPD